MSETQRMDADKAQQLPSKERLAIAFGNKIVELQEQFHADLKKYGGDLGEPALTTEHHKDVLFAAAEQFAQDMEQRSQQECEQEINLKTLFDDLLWRGDLYEAKIQKALVDLSQKDLQRVQEDATSRMEQCFDLYKQRRNFLQRMSGEMMIGHMYDVTGTSGHEFRGLSQIREIAGELLAWREQLNG